MARIFFSKLDFFCVLLFVLNSVANQTQKLFFPVFECALLILCAFDAQFIENCAPKENRERRAGAPSKPKLNF